MRRFKRVAAVAMASTMVLSLAACGSSSDSGDTSAAVEESEDTEAPDTEEQTEVEDTEDTEAADESKSTGSDAADAAGSEIDNKKAGTEYEECTLSLSWWGGDSREKATKEAIAAFEEKYPGITVEGNFAAWDGWETKQATQFNSGTASDVSQINWNWIDNWSSDGSKFVDLNDYADVLDLTQVDEASLNQCVVNDKLQGIPISMTGRIFFWNSKTFEKAGLSTPTSYAELLEAGKTFQEKLGDDYYPLALGEYDRTILMVYYLESKYGKAWVADGELQYTQEEVEDGLNMILELEENHVIPTLQKLSGDGASALNQNANWIDGHYAGIFEWDSAATKYGGETLDADNQGALVVGDYFSDWGDYQGGYSKVSMAFAISATCEHPKEAAMLINFLLNEEEGAVAMSTERGIPVSASGLAYCEEAGLLEGSQVAEANAKVLAWTSFPLDFKFESAELKDSTGVYYDVMGGLAYGDYTVEEAAETLIDGVNGVLGN